MKKNIFLMAAASAIMLTACSSEDDILQTGLQKQVTPQEVGFDVYMPAATQTRAGLEGTMTTGRLQFSEANGGGFGVYAYLVEDALPDAGYVSSDGLTNYATPYNPASPGKPNFMVNEKLLWNSTNQGWYYNPLKYWPNETDNDSQATPAEMEGDGTDHHIDRLTFFAYAPYVKETDFAASTVGILGFTGKEGTLTYNSIGPNTESNDPAGVTEPSIKYKASLNDPNKAVDLLWGVAPAGGLTYTAVNGTTVNKSEGLPLTDMTKPDVNTNMKFLFQHALARIGVKVVAAIDQVGAGGKLDPNTKITIDEITLTGYFGETGLLNLDNPIANVANWRNINNVALVANTKLDDLTKTTLTLSANTAPITIAEHLRYVGPHATPVKQESATDANDRVGVTTVKQDAIEPATYSATTPWTSSKTYLANELLYSESTPYYDAKECTTPVASAELSTLTDTKGKWFTLSQKGVFTEADAAGDAKTYTYPEVLSYYDVKFQIVAPADVTAGTYATYTAYTLDMDAGGTAGTEDDGDTFTPKADIPAAGDYVITSCELRAPYYAAGTYFKRDANYFMVVPTNNIQNICTGSPGIKTAADLEALRKVRVKIKYYITTEDEDLQAKRTQTENIIEKDVVFPSLANGKSYNLNLVLGLTSVKMEAEVDDWKVINVQADLPQNTAE